MKNRLNGLLVLLPVIGIFSVTMVKAQNPQQFLPNVENGIQNEINSGTVNPNQAQQLQNRASQIQNQELQDMSRHGGNLTPQEQARIDQETARLNKQAHRDMRMDNPNANPNWRPPIQSYPGFTGQPNLNWQQQQQLLQQQQLQRQQWLQSHPNAQQFSQNNDWRHHHHQWNGQNNQYTQQNTPYNH